MGPSPKEVTLRDYEIVYIVRPELDENQVQDAVNQVNNLIQTLGGSAQRSDVWGKRRLAYEVNRLREGYYVLTDFNLEQARLPEMEATLRISDQVFRHVIVRKPPQVMAAKPAPPPVDGETATAAQAEPLEPEPAAEEQPAAVLEEESE